MLRAGNASGMSTLESTLGQIAQMLRGGQVHQAEAACRSLLASHPRLAPAHNALGQVLIRKGDARAAAVHFQAAAENEPANAVHLMFLGRTQGLLGDFAGARASLERALVIDDALWQARVALGDVLLHLKDPEGRPTLQAGVDAAPATRQGLVSLAGSLRSQGCLEGAIMALRRLTFMHPGDASLWIELGVMLFQQRDWAACEEAARKAVACAPNMAEAHALLCRVLERTNRVDEALLAGQRAVELAPGAPSITLELARVFQRVNRHEEARDRLHQALAVPNLPDEALASLYNHLGVSLDALGMYDAAFDAIVKGQEAWLRLPRTARFSIETFPQRLRAYDSVDWRQVSRTWPTARAGQRAKRPPPIFFVGFPRSGTTLLETMLSAHPGIMASDEQPFLTEVINTVRRRMPPGAEFPAFFASLDDAEMEALEEAYWQFVARDLGSEALGERRLLDKLPLNICFLPVVRRIWPDAKVIVALRDPRDVCLSCLFQPFGPNDAMIHFARLDTTTALYTQVMGLWQRYKHELGLAWFESRYEDLVADPASRVRAILDFLGLPWDDAVLRYAERKREVRTPSYAGIAGGVHTRSVQRWRRYQKQFAPYLPRLAPLIAALGYEPSE